MDQAHNRREIMAHLWRTNSAYPNQAIPRETIATYVDSLEDLPCVDIGEACQRLILTERFFPSIALIRECAEAVGRERAVRHPLLGEVKVRLTDEQKARHAEHLRQLAELCRTPWERA